MHCRTHDHGHEACQFWGAAALLALRLVADGRLEPSLTARGYDAWRTTDPGPWQDYLDALLAAMPPEAHAHATAHSSLASGPSMCDPGHLLSAFCDAVADFLPRSPGAALATGRAAFADRAAQHVPQLRLANPQLAGQPLLGVRLSLRLELDAADTDTGVRAVLQVHDTFGEHRVADAESLWRAVPAPGTPDVTRQMESLLALRRAARAWPPLARLLEDPSRPGALALDEPEIDELLGDAVARLARVDCAVHWPRDLIRAVTGRTVIAPRPAAVAPIRLLGADQLLDFQWRASVGDQELTDAEMDVLAEGHRPFVRLRDRWVRVDAALLRRVRDRGLGQVSASEALVWALAGSAQIGEERVAVHPTGWLADLCTALTRAAHTDVLVPAALKADLRHY
ncbi:SNF2 helicase-associated domain-containing protein [Streptomyces sp. NPDC007088]|uniref:SNF2 helicase-associated domain-containing protein n=1 Tax=Streptomyces sp. NPDC007088 TaxID=3364773 RepID=UPI0036896457